MGWAGLGFVQPVGWVGSRPCFFYCSSKSCEGNINPGLLTEKSRQGKVW